jgi:hypothetical protein
MALYPDYATTADVKSQLRITDTADDAAVAIAVTAASRAIDKACDRQFGLVDAAAARFYQYEGAHISGRWAVAIYDLMTTTSLTVELDQGQDGTYERTLTYGTDFDLWPANAAGDVKPWTHLVFRPQAAAWPAGFYQELKVTASWGWTAVPTVVKQACLIQAARFFVRRDSQYGVAGSPEQGNELRLLDRLDPDVAVALTAVRRHWGAV